ncbi:hypothetical protein IAI58_22645 (plasmid) [Roseomonas marmotae]|uniref:hypothetical protein n=1 Tax=Roseomonas marmotae TaxID=2768161 RepID=UPI001AD6B62C|nr:hypothetical protein [Roseomonas marmotae]QTI82154.1 hypothetical protein IAI58_22645 [Roseomonas marmotae]
MADLDDACRPKRTILTLPAGAMPRQMPAPLAEVVIFDEARQLPAPHVTTDEEADEARQRGAQERQRERASRAQAAEILRRRREGEEGEDDGEAMLARPYRNVPIAFLSDDTLEAALTRQFADAHLIDRMWDAGQLNDWQYATANRLLQLCDEAGMLASKVALIGRSGTGHAEMSDAMAAAHATWKRLMAEIGYPGDELLISLCQGELTVRGQAARAAALVAGLRHLAQRWGIDMT